MAAQNKYPSLSNYFDDDNGIVNHKTDRYGKINDIVEHIMMEHGPDGHTDGSDVITEFICTLLKMGNQEREKLLLMKDYKEIEKIILSNG